MDSELQIALIGAGIAAVVLVVGYNKWQERRHRREAERAFKSDHRDVLLEPREEPSAGERREPGIGGVTVTLTGANDLGNAISLSATTAADGSYSFAGLRPSSAAGYTVTEHQPSNYVDGKDAAGSSGGSVAVNDVISGIVVGAGGSSANNNFGELLPVSISGYVYDDAGNDGVWDGTSAGISGVTLTLTGNNDLGQAVNGVTTTASDGSYSFTGLRPSNLFGYTVTETQAAGYDDGKDTAGSAGGNTTTNDVIRFIVLLSGGSSSINNNFGELASAGVTAIASDLDGGGQLGASDDRFLDLSVWRDSNDKHTTDAGELLSLTEAGVLSLSVESSADSSLWDAQGDQPLEQSSATLSDGPVLDTTDSSDAAAGSATALSPLSLGWAFA